MYFVLKKNFVRKVRFISFTHRIGVRVEANQHSKMSTIGEKFALPKRHIPNQHSVWFEYGQLAATYKPLNLGQGFPDYQTTNCFQQTLAEVATSGDASLHQYTQTYGHPRLTTVLSQFYSNLVSRSINPQTEILTTMGTYGALYLSITANINTEDEVIIMEPFFDPYKLIIRAAGGVPRFLPLHLVITDGQTHFSSEWFLDQAELECIFNAKTKIIVLNNPHNPTGKVFKLEELEHIAALCKKWNVLCISDEVYEWFVYKPNKHIRIGTLPGMWDRTITVCSAGKTFGITGWRLGWAYGPSNLLENMRMVHNHSLYSGVTPIQEAVAIVFEKLLTRFGQTDCYFNTLSLELMAKRDFMANILSEVGMQPIVPEGGCLMIADWTALETRVDLTCESDKRKDFRFTKWMIKNLGLQGIPLSAFYSEDSKVLPENFVRYCFFKKNECLEKAAEILNKWKL